MGATSRFYEGLFDERDQHAELLATLDSALSALSADPNLSGHLRSRVDAIVSEADSIYEISWIQSDDRTNELISATLKATGFLVLFLLTRDFEKWVTK